MLNIVSWVKLEGDICSITCPEKVLFDKNKIIKECKSPKGGIWPRNGFEDKFKIFKFGKIKPIFVGTWPSKQLYEISISKAWGLG